MATTIPTTFTGTPTIDPAKVARLVEWYESNLRDADKAAEGYDLGWYAGQSEAFEVALRLIHGMPSADKCDDCETPLTFDTEGWPGLCKPCSESRQLHHEAAEAARKSR